MKFEEEVVHRILNIERRVGRLETIEFPGVWIDFTPVLFQSASISSTISYARYTTFANTVLMQILLKSDGTGASGNGIIVESIPASISASGPGGLTVIGNVLVFDASENKRYHGAVSAASPTRFNFRAHDTANVIGAVPNFGIAASDFVGFQVAYER